MHIWSGWPDKSDVPESMHAGWPESKSDVLESKHAYLVWLARV